jgi:hypothetical protein
MLDLLIDAHPDTLTRDELAQRAGYEVTGDTVRANDVLFLVPTPLPDGSSST